MTSNRIYAVGAVVGGALGVLLVITNLQNADFVLVLVVPLVFAALGLTVSNLVVGYGRYRRDKREGRYASAAYRGRRRFKRWTWPLSVGAVVGAVVGVVYLPGELLPSEMGRGVDLLLAAVSSAFVGILLASAVELVAQGPGERGAERLGALLFLGTRHALFGLLVAGGFAAAMVIVGAKSSAYGAMLGAIVGWVAPLWVHAFLADFDGGRDFIPKAWLRSRAAVRVVPLDQVVEAGSVILVLLTAQRASPKGEIRVDLESRISADVHTAESTFEADGRTHHELRDVVASQRMLVGDLGPDGSIVHLRIPVDATPTLEHALLRVDWVVRATVVIPGRPDSIDEVLVDVVGREGVDRAAASRIALERGVLEPGETVEGMFTPPGIPGGEPPRFVRLFRRSEILLGLGETVVEEVAKASVADDPARPGRGTFSLRLPASVEPSTSSAIIDIEWSIAVAGAEHELARRSLTIANRLKAGTRIPGIRRPPNRGPSLKVRLLGVAFGLGWAFLAWQTGAYDRSAPVPTIPRPPIVLPPITLPSFQTYSFPIYSFAIPSFAVPSFAIPGLSIRPSASAPPD